jgi:hypothetical protein
MKTPNSFMNAANAGILVTLAVGAFLTSGCFVRFDSGQSSEHSGIVLPGQAKMHPAVVKTLTLHAKKNEFKTIRIDHSADEAKIELLESDDNRFSVSGQLTGESAEAIQKFVAASSHNIEDKTLSMKVGGNSYMCFRRTVNGASTVSGVCIDQITFKLPKGSRTRVLINGLPITPGAMTAEELIAAASQHPHDDSKLRAVQVFVDGSPESSLTVAQAALVIKDLAFDASKLKAANLLSRHISDPQNVAQAAAASPFESTQEEIIRALSGR